MAVAIGGRSKVEELLRKAAALGTVPDARPATPAPADPAEVELARLRAEVARAKAENEALRAAAPARERAAGPTVRRDPNGKGNVVVYGWRQRRPVCLWPSQIDDLAGSTRAGVVPGSLLDKLIEAAAGLPRGKGEVDDA